jgi:hypothetical protein
LSFWASGDYSIPFAVQNLSMFGFALLSHDATPLANFKYKLRVIIDSEVNVLPRAVRKVVAAKAVAGHHQAKKAAKAAK